MERHFTDGLKEITFADGTAKVILPNGEVQARVAPPDRVLRPALCCSLSLLPFRPLAVQSLGETEDDGVGERAW